MYGRRRSYRGGGRPGKSGRGPHHVSWQTITAYASASALTWPTDSTPPVQDTMARIGAIAGLIGMFPNTESLVVVTPDILAARRALYPIAQRYQAASGRVRHNRSSVAGWAYDSNSLMLALSAHTRSPVEALALWTCIGAHILTALGYIEQRQQFDYAQALDALADQALRVELNTTAGRLTIGSMGQGLTQFGNSPQNLFGGGMQGGSTGGPGTTSFPNTGPFGTPNPFDPTRTPNLGTAPAPFSSSTPQGQAGQGGAALSSLFGGNQQQQQAVGTFASAIANDISRI